MKTSVYSVAAIPDNPRQGWIDWLRVMACFMVVLSHCCDSFVAQFDTDRVAFLTGTLTGSLMRPCVPLFVMMTGALLLPLPSSATLSGFYRKRVGRIVPPLVFWSLTLPILAYCYFCFGATTTNPSVDITAYSSEGLVNRLWSWILNFNFDTTPLWYLYMLLGLYLIIPVISAWFESASRRDIRIILTVWAVTLLLPYLRLIAPMIGYLGNYGNMGIFGECDWNAFGTFYYISGFGGYLLLAAYLKKFPPACSDGRLLAFCIPSFIVGYALTAGAFIWFQENYPGDYAYLEIAWYFTGVNVFMMTLPVFLIMQRFAGKAGRKVRQLASLTFGIYLCHFIFVMGAYDIYDFSCLPPWSRILMMAFTAFIEAACLTYLMSLTRFTARFIK